jgi:hypothetical protein
MVRCTSKNQSIALDGPSEGMSSYRPTIKTSSQKPCGKTYGLKSWTARSMIKSGTLILMARPVRLICIAILTNSLLNASMSDKTYLCLKECAGDRLKLSGSPFGRNKQQCAV